MPELQQAEIEDAQSAAMRIRDLPEDDNPALIDAHKTFVITLFTTAVFIGVVISFIL